MKYGYVIMALIFVGILTTSLARSQEEAQEGIMDLKSLGRFDSTTIFMKPLFVAGPATMILMSSPTETLVKAASAPAATKRNSIKIFQYLC